MWRATWKLTDEEWDYIKEVIKSDDLRPALERGIRVLKPLPGVVQVQQGAGVRAGVGATWTALRWRVRTCPGSHVLADSNAAGTGAGAGAAWLVFEDAVGMHLGPLGSRAWGSAAMGGSNSDPGSEQKGSSAATASLNGMSMACVDRRGVTCRRTPHALSPPNRIASMTPARSLQGATKDPHRPSRLHNLTHIACITSHTATAVTPNLVFVKNATDIRQCCRPPGRCCHARPLPPFLP